MSTGFPLNGCLNGCAASLRHGAAERHADESLHDFLLRRHGEMEIELVALEAEIAWQGQHLHAERLVAHRRRAWLVAAMALDATLALLLMLAGIFDALPAGVAVITLVALLAGNLLALGLPRLDPVLVSLRGMTSQ